MVMVKMNEVVVKSALVVGAVATAAGLTYIGGYISSAL